MSDHSRFYAEFARLYGDLFPLSAATVDIVDQYLRQVFARRVLDVGCGTGSLALALRRIGYVVHAIDSSPDMIAAATRAQRESPPMGGGEFRIASMESLGASAAPRYDAVLCLGNTLAHAAGYDSVKRIIDAVAALLRHPGLFLVQAIDFDFVMQRGIDELTPIESGTHVLRRRYGKRDRSGMVPFRVTISPRRPGAARSRVEGQTALLALGRRRLCSYLREAGFVRVRRGPSLSGSGERGGLELVVAAYRGSDEDQRRL